MRRFTDSTRNTDGTRRPGGEFSPVSRSASKPSWCRCRTLRRKVVAIRRRPAPSGTRPSGACPGRASAGPLTLPEKFHCCTSTSPPAPVELARSARAPRPCTASPGSAPRRLPAAIGLASTWNPDLVRAVGAAVGDETRGFHHKTRPAAGSTSGARGEPAARTRGADEEGTPRTRCSRPSWRPRTPRPARRPPTLLRTAPPQALLGYNNETRRDTTSSNLGRGCCTSTSCRRSAGRSGRRRVASAVVQPRQRPAGPPEPAHQRRAAAGARRESWSSATPTRRPTWPPRGYYTTTSPATRRC